MNSLWIALLSFGGFILAYRLYGRYLGRRIFRINPQAVCPSRQFEDGIDYVPTRRLVLFGHHYTSIAGASPIVGPAIALFWGWLPALLWVVFGSIFAGAVHDFGALVISARAEGKSVGDVAGDTIGPATRVLFLLVVFFMVMIVIAVFALIIAGLFVVYPASVLPIWFEVPLAVGLGALVARRGNVHVWSLVALAFMMVSVWLSAAFLPGAWGDAFGRIPLWVWIVVLLVYSYVASTLPVQRLLQPRDYINSHQLWLTLGLIMLGLIVVNVMAAFGSAPVPRMVAPAVRADPAGAPQMFPFLFVIIACGAISGFHSLVASGTTSKQLKTEADAQSIGYGGMLGEGALSVIVIVACGAGIALAGGVGAFDAGAFDTFYASWLGAKPGLAPKLEPFITGAGALLRYVGLPTWLGTTLISVVIISFAGTTLDTSCRIQRYVVGELARHAGSRRLATRHPATAIAIGTAAALIFLAGRGGTGGMVLWPLFGTVNQLLAGLALLVVTVYLFRRGTRIVFTAVPMAFVLFMTGWAMLAKLRDFATAEPRPNWLLFVIGAAVFVLELIIIGFAVGVFARGRARLGAPAVEPDP